jgi:hypothetical protein
MALLADDCTLRLPVQSDGFAAERINEERARGEVHDARALDVSSVEVHPDSVALISDSPRRIEEPSGLTNLDQSAVSVRASGGGSAVIPHQS